MIYTCYYAAGQEKLIYPSEVYEGFGLEPDLNKDLLTNCPELKNPSTRLQLVEYACFLWHWRNPKSIKETWIGTTSYRQSDKTLAYFDSSEDIKEITDSFKIATWGLTEMYDRNGKPLPLNKQAEICHPGISEFIEDIFEHFSEEVPPKWYTETSGVFASYWAMNNKDFIKYMEYSWPKIRYALSLSKSHPYTLLENKWGTVTDEKAVGYFMERLFILWYLETGKVVKNIGKIMKVHHNV